MNGNGTVISVSTQAILYDLDGTLVDTLQDIALAMNGVLAQNGFPEFPVEEYRSRVGWGVSVLVEKTVPPEAWDNGFDRETLTGQLVAAYRLNPVVHSRPYEGTIELVDALRARGARQETGQPARRVRQAVLSNKSDELVQPIVQRLFGAGRFDLVRGALPDRPKKPDPDMTIEILGRLGVSPEECLFIGDSEVDMQTARRAGCIPVGVAWGFRNAQAVQNAGAEYMMYTVAELRKFLESKTGNQDKGELR